MNIGGLGSVGNLAGLVGSVVGLGIVAIVLLTFAPEIAGDINQIGMQSIDAGKMSSGERVNWVLTKGSHTTANEAWATPGVVKTPVTAGTDRVCMVGALAVDTAVYTPKGTLVAIDGTTPGLLTGCKWSTASRSLTALGGGSLVTLLFGAMAILLPAGSLGFLGYFGGQLVQQNIGGGTLAVAIGATVAVVIIGSILPEIFEPLDNFFVALDGNRYWIYSQGIGRLGGVLGNFLGIALIGGLITLGVMLWKGRDGESQGTGSMI